MVDLPDKGVPLKQRIVMVTSEPFQMVPDALTMAGIVTTNRLATRTVNHD
jgi:hypothetical protein